MKKDFEKILLNINYDQLSEKKREFLINLVSSRVNQYFNTKMQMVAVIFAATAIIISSSAFIANDTQRSLWIILEVFIIFVVSVIAISYFGNKRRKFENHLALLLNAHFGKKFQK
jgi:hypothetical protein